MGETIFFFVDDLLYTVLGVFLRGKKPNYGRHSTTLEGCMDFRLGLASVQPVHSTSGMTLGQSAPSGVDMFCMVFLSVYAFVLCKDESLGKYSCMHLPLHK